MNIIETLRQDGIVVLPNTIPAHHIDEFNHYLSDKPIWDKHVKFHAQGRPGIPGQSSSTSWSMEDVILAPHLFDFSIKMSDKAEEFLGQMPYLYSINAFTTEPISGATQWDIQEFHRDRDDTHFVGLFVYCTDILTQEDGPHHFVKGSHLDPDGAEILDREIISIFGKAGTAFLASTWGLHRGLRPTKKSRTLFWSRWSTNEQPWSYGWDHLSPINSSLLGARYPKEQKLRDVIKLVVK